MGPGSREDTLNGHWGSWNWQKLVGIGMSASDFSNLLDRASKEYAAQLESFTLFSAEQGQHVAGWQKMVEEFESDATKQNPYRMTRRGLTEADVLLEFEREESQRAASGVPSIHAVSPSSFVAAGLDDEQPEHIPLFLPSGLTPAQRAGEAVAGLAAIESSLRDAQLSSSLELLRRKLHVKSRLVTYKSLQARAQGANTRSKGIVNRNECKIRLHSEKFQMAWEAKRLLAGGDAEAVGWRKLLKEDIRCMQDAEELARSEIKRRAQDERRRQREDALRHEGELPPLTTDEEEERVVRGGESVRQVSWIWTGARMMGADADLEEGKIYWGNFL
ncbi:hypothetical protein B0H14DRAFT_2382755 [Mycena olivaceomarginata]|nr:hypothetical protein B0H14DRAFT_2382755 [Mycena olivaceomarginata]